MYIAINMATRRIAYKHPSVNVVLNLVHIEVPAGECSVAQADIVLKDITEADLKIIYRNELGEPIPADVRGALFNHILTMPVTDCWPEEVARLAASIGPNDKKKYKYVKGVRNPSEGIPLFADQGQVQTLPRPRAPTPPPYIPPKKDSWSHRINDSDPLPEPEPVRTSTPRQSGTTSGPSTRPKAGSSTGRVWDIADELAATITDDKALRKSVIEACVQQGINSSTASVQFGKWKASR